MSFAEWKKRSVKYQDAMRMHGIGRIDAEEIAQAAYKAGERDGRKQVEAIAANAVRLAVLAERERCANVVEAFPHWLGENGRREIAQAIRMRSNVELTSPPTSACETEK